MDDELKNNNVINEFSGLFKSSPAILVRAPGRVNLIGEHTDYNGLPVLPTSIPFTITVAVSSRQDKTIHIKNTSIKYKDNIFELSASKKLDTQFLHDFKHFLASSRASSIV